MERIPFFDANCMIGRITTAKLKFYQTKDLIKEMKYHQIDRALVFHSLSWQYDPKVGNEELIKEISPYKELFGSAVLLPSSTRELGKLKETLGGKIKAVRLYPLDQNFKLSAWNCGSILSLLEERKVPLFIEANQIDFDDLNNLCKDYPHLPIILCKTGYRLGRMLYSLLERYKNFYLETSLFLTYMGIEDVVKRFGAKRLLFGTNMPFLDAGGAIFRVIYAKILRKEKKMIGSLNLEGLIKNEN